MTAQLFGRKCEVLVETLKIDERFRIAFKVIRSVKAHPNRLDLEIANLSSETRGAMRSSGSKVVLSAGYQGTFGVIFSGNSRTIDHVRHGADWNTHIQCGDGEIAYQYARVNDTFGPGTSLADALRRVAQKTGYGLGNLEDKLKNSKFKRGFSEFTHGCTCHGPAVKVFDELIQTAGWSWSVQGGHLQVLDGPRDKVKGEAVLLTPETGLIGSPDHAPPDRKGAPAVLRVRALLQPRIFPGCAIEVRAEGIKGQFVVVKVDHHGDTRGQVWYSDMEARTL